MLPSRAGLLQPYCAESAGSLLKRRIWFSISETGGWDSTLLTSFLVTLMLLVQGPQLEQGGYKVYSRERKYFSDNDRFFFFFLRSKCFMPLYFWTGTLKQNVDIPLMLSWLNVLCKSLSFSVKTTKILERKDCLHLMMSDLQQVT